MPKQWNVMQLLIMLKLYFYFLFNQTLCWKIFGNVKSARYFLWLSALLPNPAMTVQYNLLPGRLRCLWSRVGAGVRIEEHWQPAARAGRVWRGSAALQWHWGYLNRSSECKKNVRLQTITHYDVLLDPEHRGQPSKIWKGIGGFGTSLDHFSVIS